MLCYISFMNINIDNIDKWEKLLIKTKSNNLSVCEKRILDNFDVYTITDYINLIKSNINNETEIIKKYNFKKNKRLELERKIENEELRKKILNSIKFSSIDNTVKIQLLIDKDSNKILVMLGIFREGDTYKWEQKAIDRVLPIFNQDPDEILNRMKKVPAYKIDLITVEEFERRFDEILA